MSEQDFLGERTIGSGSPVSASDTDDRRENGRSARLTGNLGIWAIVFMVLAAASPLGVMGGTVPIGISVGNGVGFPMAFIAGGVILTLFAVGYTAMTKYVPNAGAFYSYIGKGLGDRIAVGAAFLAMVAYLAETIAVFGLLAAGGVSLFDTWGMSVPWLVFAIIGILIVGLLGYRHISLTATVCSIFMAGEVLIILALDLAVILKGGGPEGFSTGFVKPSTFMSGAPGLALLFAFLSFLGVEATAVYRNEARKPDRTVPRATYLAIILVGLFYLVSTWALISGWGQSKALHVANSNPVGMLPDATKTYLGGAAEQVVQVLFVTSLFICVLSFHNIESRYIFTLANRGALPKFLGRPHRMHNSPHAPSLVISAISLVAVVLASILKLDPSAQLYSWFAGACTVGFIVLLVGVSVSAVVFFGRQRGHGTAPESMWVSLIAPGASALLLVGVLVLVMTNLKSLVGGSTAVAAAVVGILVLAFVVGVVTKMRRPNIEIDVNEDELLASGA